MRKWTFPAALAAVVAVALVSYSVAGDKAGKHGSKHGSGAVAIGAPAPQFSLQDQDGKTHNLADYNGKIVVLEWFNEECPVVVRHYKADTMNSLASKYADKDVVWLAVNSTSGKSNDANKAAAAEWKIERPILNDSTGQVGKMYGAKTTPHMYVIDKNGTLAYMGGIDNDQRGDKADKVNYVDKAVGELLAGNSVSEPESKPYGCSVKYASK
jgi:peroxiredoxin